MFWANAQEIRRGAFFNSRSGRTRILFVQPGTAKILFVPSPRFSPLPFLLLAFLITAATPALAVDTLAGSPRRWEPGMSVGPYSALNLRTGHTITAIPLFSMSGRGPSLHFALYHNAGDGTARDALPPEVIETPSDSLDTPAWRTSYSNELYFDGPDVVVIHDDGTQDFFKWDTDKFFALPGVFLSLTYGSGKYTLADKAGNKRVYDDLGALQSTEDPSGNVLTLQYDDDRLTSVTDASGRYITLVCDGNGLLTDVYDPVGRQWTLYTDEITEELIALVDPVQNYDEAIDFTYESDGSIETLTDKNGNATEFEYDDEALVGVLDPSPFTTSQSFSYAGVTGGSETTYQDRRGEEWVYFFSNSLPP